MKPLQKAAVFLMLIGVEQGRRIIALLDSREISVVAKEIGKLTTLTPQVQKEVWAEFEQLGYEEGMNPTETLSIIRLLFHGSRIGDNDTKSFLKVVN